MLKKTSIILLLLLSAVFLFLLYQKLDIPKGVTPQGELSNTNALLAFWGSIIAFSASIIGLLQKIIELIIEVKREK